MTIASETQTATRMTQDQAVKLAAFITSIRPEWSAAKLRGLMQAHTYGDRGLEVIGVEELSTRLLEAAFTSKDEYLTELPNAI